MNRNKVGLIFLSIAAGIAIFTALAHMSCIFLGESCYRSQLAPEAIIQSAVNGSLLAPLGTIFVSSLFLLCAIYALSAANIIIKLPLLRTAIYSISTLCILRGCRGRGNLGVLIRSMRTTTYFVKGIGRARHFGRGDGKSKTFW